MSTTVSRPRRGAKPTRPRSPRKPRSRFNAAVQTSRLLQELGKKLLALRSSRGLTQEAAARLSQMSVREYQRLEGAEKENVKLSTVWKVAKGFKVEASRLIARGSA